MEKRWRAKRREEERERGNAGNAESQNEQKVCTNNAS
jgi:hypothetical protein